MTHPALATRSTPPARLLVVAPDRPERYRLQHALLRPNREVLASHDPRAMDDPRRQGVHLLLLDPKVEPPRSGQADAWWRLRRLREQHRRLPVIVLQAGDATDRSVAYEIGADAVWDPGSDTGVLQAQVDALLRRAREAAARKPDPAADPEPAPGAAAEPIRFGAWSLDPGTRSLHTATGMRVALAPAEYRLLRVFLARPGHALARQALLDLARGAGTDQLERNIDLLVSRLRQKLADDARTPRLIRTVRGVGYLFDALEG